MDGKGDEFARTRDNIRLLLEEGHQFYAEKGRILNTKHEQLSLAFENVEQYVFARIKEVTVSLEHRRTRSC